MRLLISLVLIALLTSCKSNSLAEIDCQDLPGIPAGGLLLLGEMHGSVESPRIAGQIACQRAKLGPTALGLEVPVSEQSAINRYLDSTGDLAARETLISGTFWQKSRDGRSSAAMLGLVERMRVLSQSGLPLAVFAFDSQVSASSDRNALLASSIREYRVRHPDQSIVALMGNAHAGQASFSFDGKTVNPSGKLLDDLSPISVMLAYGKGSVWACMPDCTIHPISSSWGFGKPTGFVQAAPADGYDYSYILPTITASPPAAAR